MMAGASSCLAKLAARLWGWHRQSRLLFGSDLSDDVTNYCMDCYEIWFRTFMVPRG